MADGLTGLLGGRTPMVSPVVRPRPLGVAPRRAGASPLPLPPSPGPVVRALPRAIRTVNEGGKPKSLLGQIGDKIKQVPAGVAGLVKAGAEDLTVIGRLPIDAVTGRLGEVLDETGTSWGGDPLYNEDMMTPRLRSFIEEQGLPTRTSGIRGFAAEYMPLTSGMGESLAASGQRWYESGIRGDYSAYREASDEGRTVDVALEDISNLALIGGVASKALGRLGGEVLVPNRAVAAAVEGGGVTRRSLGAMAADAFAVDRRIIPPRLPSMTTVTEAGKVVPMEAPAAVFGGTGSGTGLAGMANRAGNVRLAQGLDTAGRWTKGISSLGEAVDDMQLGGPLRLGKYVLDKTPIPNAVKRATTSGIERMAQGEGTLASIARFASPEERALRTRTRQFTADLEREKVASDRRWIEAPRLAQTYGVTDTQSRAALLDIDQRITPWVETLRKMRAELGDTAEADQIMERVIERAYPNVPDQLRPTLDDVRTFIDWRDGLLDDTTAAAMHQVAESVTEGAERATTQGLRSGLLDEEQVGNEMLTVGVEQARRKREVGRDRAQRDWEKVTAQRARGTRVANARAAINAEMPGPPVPRSLIEQGRKAGIAHEAAKATRAQLRKAQTDVARALADYERVVKAGEADTGVIARLGRELDRKVEQWEKLNAQLDTTVRRRDATMPLSKVTERVTGQELPDQPQPPTPTRGPDYTVTELRDRARAQADADARPMLAEIERMNAEEGPPIIPPGTLEFFGPGRRARINQYTMEGFLGRPGPDPARPGQGGVGAPLDQWAFHQRSRLGNVPMEDLLERYFDTIDAYLDTRARAGDDAVFKLAEETGLSQASIEAALRGNAAGFQAEVAADVTNALQQARSVFDEMEPSIANAYLDELRRMVDEGASEAELMDTLADIYADAGVAREVLGPISGGVIEPTDLVDWVTGKVEPRDVIERIVGDRSRMHERIIGRLEGRSSELRSAVQRAEGDQRSLRRVYDRANAEQARAETVAARKLNQAGNVADRAAAAAEAVDQLPSLAETTKAPGSTRAWKRYGDAPSQAERAVYSQGALDGRDNAAKAQHDRARRRVDDWTEQIANVETELGRDYVERLRTDINAPAMNGFKASIRGVETRLGGLITGPGILPRVDGVVGRIAADYGVYQETIAALYDETRHAAGDYQPQNTRTAMQKVLDEHGVKLSVADAKLLDRSFMTDQLLYEVDEVIRGSDSRANTPFRVIDAIRAKREMYELPDDVMSTIERKWDTYMRRRNKHLTEMMDEQAAAMPGRYRAVGSHARRQVRALLDEAEAIYQSGDTQTAAILTTMAEDVPTTLRAMVDAGIDPTHLTGGNAVNVASSRSSSGVLSESPLRMTQMLSEGLRPMDLQGVVQLEINEANKLLTNRAAEYLVGSMGKRVDQVVADTVADWKVRHPYDDVVPSAELRDALRDAGWSLPPGMSGAALNVSSIVIPSEVAKHLRAADLASGAGWNVLRTGNQWFKTSVLPLSPKWLTGNIVGNAFMAMFNGGMSPLELARTMDEIARGQGGWREFLRQGGMPSWAPDELASHALTYNEHKLRYGQTDLSGVDVGQGTNRVKAFLGDTIAKSYNLNEFVDNMTRSAVYLSKLRKGEAPTLALRHALDAMGDFTRMTPIERRVVREVFPFYAWMRHQTQAAMRLHAGHPARAAMLYHLTSMFSQDDEYSAEMLGLLGSRVPVGGGFFNLGGLSPFGNPTELPLDPTHPTTFLRNVSPVIDVPIRTLTGFDIGQMKGITRPPDQQDMDMFGREVPTSPVRRFFDNPINAIGEVGYQVAGELPQTRALRDLVLGPEVTRYGSGDATNFTRPASTLSTIARGLGVPWMEQIDVAEQERRFREIERERRRNG